MTRPDENLARQLKRIAGGLSAFSGVVGLVILFGWVFDVDILTRLLPGAERTTPQTALTLTLAAASLWLYLRGPSFWCRGPARAMAVLVFLSGSIAFGEYVFRQDFGVDQLIYELVLWNVPEDLDAGMSPISAISFVFLGIALLAVEFRARRNYSLSSWLCVPPLFFSLIAFLGYGYGVQSLYQVGYYTAISFPSCLGLLALASGILCARPARKPALLFTIDNQGGYFARRLIVVALFVPPVLAWWWLMGEQAGLFEGVFGMAVYTLAIMVILVTVVLFVTDRLGSVEARLKRQTEINRTVINAAPAAMFLMDPRNRVTFANNEVKPMLGWSPEELTGSELHEILQKHPVDGAFDPAQKSPLVRLAKDGCRVREHEDIFFTRDGRTIDVLCSMAPLLTEDGTLGSVMIVQDITLRKQIERALDVEVKRFESLANMIPQLAWSTTADGDVDYFNDRWYEYIGVSRLSDQGSDWADFLHPEDVEKTLQCWRQACGTGQPYEARYRLRRGSDGVYRWFIGRAVPIRDRDGNITRWFGTSTDIEDQHREGEKLEEQVADRTAVAEERAGQVRQLTMELTDAEERERGRLARLLHDDLQQLLVAAKLQVPLIGRPGSPPERAVTVETLISQAIEAARSLSKELAPPVLYDQGLGAALCWLGRSAQQRYELKVDVEVTGAGKPEDQWLRVFLFEGVRELLLNVAKHAEADQVRIVLNRSDDEVCVLVEDFGKGFVVDAVRSGSGNNGSGLFFVQHRTALIGGSVEIDSAPGKGTRITITVPLSASPLEDDDLLHSSASQGN